MPKGQLNLTTQRLKTPRAAALARILFTVLFTAYEGDPPVPKVVPKDQWYLPPAKPGDAPGNDRHQP